MMTSDYPSEKTKYGEQYIIAGTDQRTNPKPKKRYYKLEGDQYC